MVPQRSTTQTVVRFNSAFVLPGFDAPQPPGDYRVDLDEEPLEGAYETWPRWLRQGLRQ